ncbi:MAG: hypothetical protein WCI51_08320 [Lentisphaerota bacterium]
MDKESFIYETVGKLFVELVKNDLSVLDEGAGKYKLKINLDNAYDFLDNFYKERIKSRTRGVPA